MLSPVEMLYLLGVFVAMGLIINWHSLVSDRDLSKLNIASFNINGYISVPIVISTLLDVLFMLSLLKRGMDNL
jgi:4-hydroxybenzoate polyprenyltransferase